ncbi:M1-specific T cell receptor beta chain-like [Podarcis lilfordi]|nr:M1-specific T cell receptor beta chain-like [Podarcis lilfordi]
MLSLLPVLIALAASFPCTLTQIVLTQSDPILKKPGESHKLTCAVTGFDVNSYYMDWFRQKPGKGLEWLVHYYKPGSTDYYSPTIQGRFIATKDSSNFYLQMNNLKAEDTAVYYCARHTE